MIPITPITPAAPTYDALWVTSLNINAYSPTQPVVANVVVTPMSTATQTVNTNLSVNVQIPDVFALAATNVYIANAMGSIFAYIADQIASGSIVFPGGN